MPKGREGCQEIATRIRQRRLARGDKWHLDEVVISITGKKHDLLRAVEQDGFGLDVLVQSWRDTKAAMPSGSRAPLRATGRHYLLPMTESAMLCSAERKRHGRR
jgi:putative transposase